jgi:hypothetical protein
MDKNKEIRFIFDFDNQKYQKLKNASKYDYRFDFYFENFRLRKLKEKNKPWRYEKISSSQAGLAVKKKEKLSEAEFNKLIKESGNLKFIIKVESLYPKNIEGKELYLERVSDFFDPSLKYFTTEYDPSENGDFKDFRKDLDNCKAIKNLKNLGNISMEQLYYKMKNKKL